MNYKLSNEGFTSGAKHSAINALKLFLNRHFAVPESRLMLNAELDAPTQAALRDFQKHNRLTETGNADRPTLAKIAIEMNDREFETATLGNETIRDLFGTPRNAAHFASFFAADISRKKKRELAKSVAGGAIVQSVYDYVSVNVEKVWGQCSPYLNDMPRELVKIVWAAAKEGATDNQRGWDLTAQMFSIMRRESARGEILQKPTGDAGPAQLTTWWKRNYPELIVGNAYGTWNGRSDVAFDGNVWDNIATLRNIVLFNNALHGSFDQTAYWYGPGNDKSPRQAYADGVMNNYKNMYKPFFECMANKLVQ